MTNSEIRGTAISAAILLWTVLLAPEGLPSVSGQVIGNVLSDHNRLSYGAYEITISRDKRGERSTTVVKKGSIILARWVNRDAPINDWSNRTGLVRLLGTRTKQLIIQQSSGGAHCCLTWRIYDLYPKFRLILDSTPYPIEDSMDEAELIDIDRNGVLELMFYSNRFSYFDNHCFACLGRPPVVFKYDIESGKYLPANHIFRKFALSGVQDETKRIDELNRDKLDSFPYVLDVVLRYVYAGMQRDAFRFFDRYYSGKNVRALKLKIKNRLRADGVYRFLYSASRKP